MSCSVDEQTPPPNVRSAPPLPGEARVLRTSGLAQSSQRHQKPLVFELYRTGRVRELPKLSVSETGGGFLYCSVDEQTPPPHVRSAPFNSGMIAPGNHNFERFAALCNTLPGEAGALRTSGLAQGSQRHRKPLVSELYRTGRVRAPTYRYRLRAALSGGIAAPGGLGNCCS